jgi:hypothetical protein
MDKFKHLAGKLTHKRDKSVDKHEPAGKSADTPEPTDPPSAPPSAKSPEPTPAASTKDDKSEVKAEDG